MPVEALVKCRMQDNLEFLQWTKRFWDQHYAGGDYDAYGRRRASGPAGAGAAAAATPSAAPGSRTSSGTARRGTTPTTTTTTGARTKPGAGGAGGGAGLMALQQENAALKENVTGLERERDFYFLKLRDIELLLQRAVEADPEIEKDEDGLPKQIQNILYSTEVCIRFPIAPTCEMRLMFGRGGGDGLADFVVDASAKRAGRVRDPAGGRNTGRSRDVLRRRKGFLMMMIWWLSLDSV